MYKIPDIWLGDIRSYLRVAEASAWLRANPGVSPKALMQGLYEDDEDDSKEEEEEDKLTRMMNHLADAISFKVGTVGVVEVSGDLVQETNYFNSWFGVISYDTVVYAVRKFIEDPDVTSIAMLWATSGGSAAGIDSAGESLREMGKEKDIYSYVKTQASSAGYWLTTETKKIYGPRMAEVGSVGAVIEYRSIARMLEERGIDTKVIRSGEYKALGHPAEPINEKAVAMLEKKVRTFGGFFTQQVASRRPVSLDEADKWAKGQVFFMEEAVSLGLADGILNLETLLERLDQSDIGSQSGDGTQYKTFSQSILLRGGSMAKELKLTDEQQAALASGATPESLGIETQVEDPLKTPEADASAGASGETPPVEDEGKAPETELDNKPASDDKPTDMVAFLKDELRTAQTALASATAKLEAGETVATAQAIVVDLLKPIAAEATGRLQVALGQSPSEKTLAAMSPADLGVLYATTKKDFEARFKIGQQSAEDGQAKEISTEQTAAQLGLHVVNESA